MTDNSALPITIRQVTKAYGDMYALDHVDLDVKSGEFLTLLGPSGSGKTTLLMALAGFTRPDHGSIKFGDEEIIRKPPHTRNVGMVFQNYALFPHMTVAENVGFPLKIRKLKKRDIAERVEGALDLVQLGGYGERQINQMSGGQKQRVALARAIVFAPRILLMDEPLSALDKKLREHMQIELRRLHEKLGMTTVYVTHDQREALTMSDRIAVINAGRLMQLAAPRELYENPANRFVADFIGESTFLPVQVSGTDVTYGGKLLQVSRKPDAAGDYLLIVRPERLRVLDDGPMTDYNTFKGRVQEVVYQGDTSLMYVEFPGGTSVAVRGVVRSGEDIGRHETGSEISLGLHGNDTVLIPAEAE